MADEPVSAVIEESTPPPATETEEQTPNPEVTSPGGDELSQSLDFPEFKLDLEEPAQTPETPAFTDEDIAKFIATKTHDDLKHIPAYNAQIQRAISKQREEARKVQEENYQLQQWDEWFRRLPPQKLLEARENPDYDAMYIKVRNWRRLGSPVGGVTREAIAGDMLKGIQDYFKSDTRFADVVTNWDEYVNETDLGTFVTKVIDTGMKKREKEITKLAETKAKAYITDYLAKHHMTLPSPETQKSSPAAGAGGLTYEMYVQATPEQALKFDKKEVDEMLARHRTEKR